MQALIERLELEVVPLSDDHAKLAIEAFRRFGKGRHPAGLNYGDCFSYALPRRPANPCCSRATTFHRPILSEPYDDAYSQEADRSLNSSGSDQRRVGAREVYSTRASVNSAPMVGSATSGGLPCGAVRPAG